MELHELWVMMQDSPGNFVLKWVHSNRGKISQHQHTTLDSGIFFGGLRGMNPFELNPNPRSQHVLSSSLLAFCRSCTNLRPYQNERAQDADNPDQQNSD